MDGYGPSDLQEAYDLTYPSESYGAGETVAIVGFGHDPTSEADLATYRAFFDLPPCTSKNNCFAQKSFTEKADGEAEDEEALDVDMVSAICPNCNILVVEAKSDSAHDLTIAEQYAVASGAHYVSNSWSIAEDKVTLADFHDPSYSASGVMTTADTGDYGYAQKNGTHQAQWPAILNTVTAVGGTSLTSISPRSETAWSRAGSGCSSVISVPKFQRGLKTGCDVFGVDFRAQADVSAVADPNTGVAVYDARRGWFVEGGTSAATPIIAAFFALIGNTADNNNSFIYENAGSLFNVTSGSNSPNCNGSPICEAGCGWNGPTGLGSPNGLITSYRPPPGCDILYSFAGPPNDGKNPVQGLVDVDGTLYGATYNGGSGCSGGSSTGCGTVFAVNESTGAESVLHSFLGGSYGDGYEASAGPIAEGSTLYGTTGRGGSIYCPPGCGTVYEINTSGSNYQLLHVFGNSSSFDGRTPLGSLIAVGGELYGTTYGGGGAYVGTVFQIATSGAESVLYSFHGGSSMDGTFPEAGLLAGSELYGTTTEGGATGNGTVFAVNSSTGKESVIYSFEGGADGGFPNSSLVALDGELYGTAQGGYYSCGSSSFECGIVFAVNPSSGTESVVYSFKGGADGADPNSLIDVGGTLYGTTGGGGAACSCGTVFKITSSGETVIHKFTDVRGPRSLTYVNGMLYGTAAGGGAHGDGAVFRIAP